MPLKNEKKHFFLFFPSTKGMVLLSREVRLCLSETGKISFLFFPSARGTVVLSREPRPCLPETKKTCFYLFFLLREARFCFYERRDCAFARVTDVPLGNEKKMCFVFLSFCGRHGFAFARGTVVLFARGTPCLFRKGKRRALGSSFSFVFCSVFS